MAEPQRDYPPPSADVNSARDVGVPASTGGARQHAAPDKDAIDADFTEVGHGVGRGSAFVAVWAAKAVGRGLKAFWDEALGPAIDRTVEHGASEIPHLLYTGSGYVPYGQSAMPVGTEGGIHGKPEEKPAIEPAQQQEPNGFQVYGTDASPASNGHDPLEYARFGGAEVEKHRGRSL